MWYSTVLAIIHSWRVSDWDLVMACLFWWCSCSGTLFWQLAKEQNFMIDQISVLLWFVGFDGAPALEHCFDNCLKSRILWYIPDTISWQLAIVSLWTIYSFFVYKHDLFIFSRLILQLAIVMNTHKNYIMQTNTIMMFFMNACGHWPQDNFFCLHGHTVTDYIHHCPQWNATCGISLMLALCTLFYQTLIKQLLGSWWMIFPPKEDHQPQSNVW